MESRPEYISESKIRSAVEILGGKKLEIAIGLESSNEVIRNLFLNKGISLKEFERAVSIVNNYAFSRAYVLLKPPSISEKESINDAISSIKYAFNVGVNTVSLEPATIQEGTLLHYLWSLGEYRPPWLWSITEVVKNCAEYGKLIVGMFQFYPPPIDVPRNCSKCDDEVISTIKMYNRTLNANVFETQPYCECYEIWRRHID